MAMTKNWVCKVTNILVMRPEKNTRQQCVIVRTFVFLANEESLEGEASSPLSSLLEWLKLLQPFYSTLSIQGSSKWQFYSIRLPHLSSTSVFLRLFVFYQFVCLGFGHFEHLECLYGDLLAQSPKAMGIGFCTLLKPKSP